MYLVEKQRHEQCLYFDRSEQSPVEVIIVPKGKKSYLPIRTNEVVFFMEGELRFAFSDFMEYKAEKGEMMFFPAGGRYYFEAFEETTVLVFRIDKPMQICENLNIEQLYQYYFSKQQSDKRQEPHFSSLAMNERIRYFVTGVHDYLADGVRCQGIFRLVIQQFTLLLSVYYSKEEVFDFLYLLAASEDSAFEVHIRRQWHLFRTVGEIAESMWMTPRKFSARFKEVFGQTPYQWMKENRAKLIFQELTTTDKMVKQIALEQLFTSKSQFTKFCIRELGATPTDIRANNSNSIVAISRS